MAGTPAHLLEPPYALFVCIPAIGHASPLIQQARELERRGWRVALASTSDLRLYVEANRVAFVDLGPAPGGDGARRDTYAHASGKTPFITGTLRIMEWVRSLWPTMYDGLVASVAADRPDVAVIDLISSAGLDAADAAGIRTVVNNADVLPTISTAIVPPVDGVPMLFSGKTPDELTRVDRLTASFWAWLGERLVSATYGRRLNALRRSRGLRDVDVNATAAGRPILIDSAFGLEFERPLPTGVVMVGPMIDPEPAPPSPALRDWIADGPPVAYVSLGTIAVPPAGLIQRIAGGLSSSHFRALWMLPSAQRDALPAVPATVRVEEWLPSQVGVLAQPNVRSFVTHCGVNSVHESIAHDVPMVGIPLFADQLDMAARVRFAGVGVTLDKHRFTSDELRRAVAHTIVEPRFRAKMPALRAEFARAGGVARAADVIEATAGRTSGARHASV